jgi:hypothetical protein
MEEQRRWKESSNGSGHRVAESSLIDRESLLPTQVMRTLRQSQKMGADLCVLAVNASVRSYCFA